MKFTLKNSHMQKTILFLVLIFAIQNVYSQILNEESFKYWYYRDRLRYFVYPGSEDGASVLMTVRNSGADGGPYRQYNGTEWGQTRKMNGYYIGLLATEYKLLKDNGQYSDAAATLQELNLALDALIRMDKCEDIEPWYESYENHDGFFIRSDVPPVLSSNMTEYLNFELASGSYSEYVAKSLDYPGRPFAIDPTVVLTPRKYESNLNYYYYNPCDNIFSDISTEYLSTGINSDLYWNYWKSDKFTSNDEIVGTFMGLALVPKCVDDIATRNKAIDIAFKSLIFALGQSDFLYYMKFPDGERITAQNGGFSGGVFYGISKCVGHMMGAGPLFGTEGIFNYLVGLSVAESPISCDGDKSMYSKLVAISDASGIHSVSYSLSNIGGLYRWQTFYQLLWAVVFDKDLTKKKYNYPFQLLIQDLMSAPCGGPYHNNINGNSFHPGWACQYKYDASLNGQYGNDFERTGVFPGADYMLLYNLACLAFPDGFDYDGQHYSFPYYVNLNNRILESTYLPAVLPGNPHGNHYFEFGSTNNPGEIRAISTIVTNMIVADEAHVIGTNQTDPTIQGDVTLKAGESITLTDGFRVDAGAHFLARIESYSCGGVSYKNMAAPPWDENYRGCFYDTLISVPMEKRAPIVYSEDNYEEADFDMPLWNDYYYMNDTTAAMELAVGAWLNPNPCGSSATLTVVSESEQQLTIELYDMTGIKRETVFNDIADQNLVLDLNLSSYASGTYMLRITGSGGVKVLRFVKE